MHERKQGSEKLRKHRAHTKNVLVLLHVRATACMYARALCIYVGLTWIVLMRHVDFLTSGSTLQLVPFILTVQRVDIIPNRTHIS
jgi:hypothetical protein